MTGGALFFLPVIALVASADLSDPAVVQPHIESLKRKYGIKPPVEPPPAAEVAAPRSQEIQPYIDKLRRNAGIESEPPRSAEIQPYIESVKAGRELEPSFRKRVEHAAGFALVTSNRFNITSDNVQANPFNQVYTPDEKYSPSVDVFYERQLFRSRYAGSLGPIARLTYITTKGKGIFTKTGTSSADTEFRFQALPVSLGVSYRFVLPRFVVPFAQLAAMGVPYIETRNDEKASRKGISRGFSAVGGVALNLDWIGRANAWEQYDAHGILHTYLVAQVEFIRTLSGPVKFNYDGTFVGLSFEF